MRLERCGPTLNQSSINRSLVSKLGLSLSGKPLSEISRLSPYSAPPLHLDSGLITILIFLGGTDFLCINWRFFLPYSFRSISVSLMIVKSKSKPLVPTESDFILIFLYGSSKKFSMIFSLKIYWINRTFQNRKTVQSSVHQSNPNYPSMFS